jgi:hypothetical protein
MKTFAAIIVLLATMILAHCQTNKFPINRGLLQTDLDAGRHSITNVSSILDSNRNPIFDAYGSSASSSNAANARATNIVGAATNVIGLPSGLAAFSPTNQFDTAGAAAAVSNAFAPGVLTVTLSSNLVFARDSTEFVLNGCADTNANGVYVLSNAASIGLIYTNSANTAYYVVSNQFHSGPQRSWVLTNDSVGAIARSENVSTAPRQPSDGTQWTQILSTNAPTFWWHSTASYTNPVTTYFPFGYVLVDPAASTNGSKGPLNAFTNIDRAIAFAATNDSVLGVTVSNNFPLNIRLTAGLHPQGSIPITPGMSLTGEGRGVSIINNGGVLFSGMSNYVADFKCNILQCSGTANVSNSVVENMEIGTSLADDALFFLNVTCYGITVRNSHLITRWDATQGINIGTFINVGIDGFGGTKTSSSGLHGYNVTHEDCNYTIVGGYVNLSGLNTNLNNPFNGSPPTNACIWITGTNATVNLYGPTLIHDTNNLAIYNFVGATNVNGWFHDVNSSTGASTTVTVHGTNYFITGAITTTTPVAADFYGGLGSKSWLSNQTQFISSYNGSAISTAKVGP